MTESGQENMITNHKVLHPDKIPATTGVNFLKKVRGSC